LLNSFPDTTLGKDIASRSNRREIDVRLIGIRIVTIKAIPLQQRADIGSELCVIGRAAIQRDKHRKDGQRELNDSTNFAHTEAPRCG
jgi:hypothetical protein